MRAVGLVPWPHVLVRKHTTPIVCGAEGGVGVAEV
jgi:Na+(H+)/acetate symporter ActP